MSVSGENRLLKAGGLAAVLAVIRNTLATRSLTRTELRAAGAFLEIVYLLRTFSTHYDLPGGQSHKPPILDHFSAGGQNKKIFANVTCY